MMMASYRLNRPIFMGNFNNVFSLPYGITLSVDYRYQSKGNTMKLVLNDILNYLEPI